MPYPLYYLSEPSIQYFICPKSLLFFLRIVPPYPLLIRVCFPTQNAEKGSNQSFQIFHPSSLLISHERVPGPTRSIQVLGCIRLEGKAEMQAFLVVSAQIGDVGGR